MRNDYYPEGFVMALIDTEEVTSATSDVLNKRIEQKKVALSFFDNDTFTTVQAVCDRLIPQTLKTKIDLAIRLDAIISEGKGNGWRYNNMPPDKDAYKKGMNGIDETSKLMFEKSFKELAITEQDEVLKAIQLIKAPGKIWETISANLFFEEVLSQLTEIYYSHPLALDEIGVAAFADAKGWQKIGLDELEKREPEALKNN